MSAHTILEGLFDFNRTPMAPPGTKILIHEKPAQRKSWDPHGTEGWYLGPAMEHYRCYQLFVNKTKAERITDTVEFFPEKVTMPYPTPTDIAIKAAHDLVSVLKQPTPSTPFAHIGHNQLQAIDQLADIFNQHRRKNTTTRRQRRQPRHPFRYSKTNYRKHRGRLFLPPTRRLHAAIRLDR